ncbi:MAG: hypothetical protein ACM3KR_01510 [Deltaproteobacteria bacterium]
MTKSCPRKIVVLRDIPSNIIEEAILVLKSDTCDENKNSNEKNGTDKKRDFIIIKEAEMIISNYITNRNSVNNEKNKLIESKKWYIDFLINMGLIVGIGIFAFMLIKML